MPIIHRAIKKMHHDRKRTRVTSEAQITLRNLIKSARKHPTAKSITTVFSALDKAAKRNIIHANKASRLKSRLSKLLKK